VIIAQISDTHLVLDTPDASQRISDFERTIADLNSLDPAPDVIVHTGDIVHNGRPDEYARAVAILAKARAPVYVLAGNKDDRANLRAAFSAFEYLSRESKFIEYAIEDYAVRLIAVDTLSAASNKGDFCPERARRLIEMIDAERSKPIAVFAPYCTPRASSLSSAAMFTAGPQGMSAASRRQWCRASRRRCARASIHRT
jgi:Icc protein